MDSDDCQECYKKSGSCVSSEKRVVVVFGNMNNHKYTISKEISIMKEETGADIQRQAGATRLRKTKSELQAKHHTGVHKQFSIDRNTQEALEKIVEFFTKINAPVSQSVVLRRAMRAYLEKLAAIKTDEEAINEEIVKTYQAAKGL